MAAMNIRANLVELGRALGRVGNEYRDMKAEGEGEQHWFDVLIYLGPLSRVEGRRIFERVQQNEKVAASNELPVKTRRDTLAIYAKVPGPNAPTAMQRALDVYRTAINDLGLHPLVLRAEVEQGDDPNEVPAKKPAGKVAA